MASGSDDYRDVRSIAIHADDVVTAYEANRTAGPRAVLRITPPFNGRMRARLHLEGADEYEDSPRPIHVEPARLIDEARVPEYPTPAETEDRLRADSAVEYTVDRHHDRHTNAVREWRETIADAIVETVDLEGSYGSHSVRILTLG